MPKKIQVVQKVEPVRVGDADGTQSSTGGLLIVVHIKMGIAGFILKRVIPCL